MMISEISRKFVAISEVVHSSSNDFCHVNNELINNEKNIHLKKNWGNNIVIQTAYWVNECD